MTTERLKQMPWDLWARQALAVASLEMKRTFFNSRALFKQKAGLLRLILLAFAPAAIFAAHSLHEMGRGRTCNLGQDMHVMAGMFQFFYMRLAIFFGCLMVFLGLFRGEMRERTLHYALLTPIRREVLVTGKYLGALAGMSVIYSAGILLAFWTLSWHLGWNNVQEWLFRSGGVGQIFQYVIATVMAVVGYGSVFLLVGVVFKNPIVPAGALLLWEAISPILPSLLKKFSVIFYLRSLCPVDVPVPPGAPPLITMFAVNTAPLPAWIAVTGLVALTALVLAYAGVRTRRLEISYASE